MKVDGAVMARVFGPILHGAVPSDTPHRARRMVEEPAIESRAGDVDHPIAANLTRKIPRPDDPRIAAHRLGPRAERQSLVGIERHVGHPGQFDPAVKTGGEYSRPAEAHGKPRLKFLGTLLRSLAGARRKRFQKDREARSPAR